MDNIGQKRLFQATYLGLPLIASGLLEKHFDDKFRRLRNGVMPEFDYRLDNYTQNGTSGYLTRIEGCRSTKQVIMGKDVGERCHLHSPVDRSGTGT